MSLWRKRKNMTPEEEFNCKEMESKVKQDYVMAIKERTWVGLTEDEAIDLLPVGDWEIESTLEFAKAIEAKLKEKNT
jgi:hypothetical protein